MAQEGCSLTFYDFLVHHDGHGVLSLTVRDSGWGAYPATGMQSFNFQANGEALTAADALLPEATEPLLELLRKQQEAAIAQARRGLTPEEHTEFDEMLTSSDGRPNRIEAKHLEQFVIEAEGLRFYYHFGFRRALEALTPLGEYFIPYAQLQSYLAPSGPLSWAIGRPK